MKTKLSGQLWEECPKCGCEPIYISLGGYCQKCGKRETIKSSDFSIEPYRKGQGQGFGDGEDGE